MNMQPYSCHIFLFPFRWHIQEKLNERLGEQIAFKNITEQTVLENWERIIEPENQVDKEQLFNEKNYFYEFVHTALYDNGCNDNTNIVRHYERREPKHQDVYYHITKDKEYKLKVSSINLNLYSTGVGVLSFYLYNESYPDSQDILTINQYGRRIYPPFYADKIFHNELAESIGFSGLNGIYTEDFQAYKTEDSNLPAGFIHKMIHEVAPNIEIKSVIDDRMYTLSWYKNNELANSFQNDIESFISNEYWYKYVFVDAGDVTCQNDKMRVSLSQEASYKRWQNYWSLYGISKYSFVYLTNNGCPPHLTTYFETEYVRMAELVMVQKASVLRFSAEVTNISSMDNERKDKTLADKVRSLYKEYIRFINQIHFREVSAQDQAIELYDMLYKSANLTEHVEKLDNEIGELYNYISLQGDKEVNKTMSRLTWLATIFVPATFMAGIFGMNNNLLSEHHIIFKGSLQFTIVALAFFGLLALYIINKKGGKK